MRHYFPDGQYMDFSKDHLDYLSLEGLLFNIANEGRFVNQVPWSVLQHCLACGRVAEMMFAGNTALIQHAYLHDLSEGVTRDLPSPLKKLIGKAWYTVENMIQGKMLDYLRVGPLGDDDAVYLKAIDKTMAFIEATNFFAPEKAAYMKTQCELQPELIVFCTSAFNAVHHVAVWDDNDELNPEILTLYKQIINATIV